MRMNHFTEHKFLSEAWNKSGNKDKSCRALPVSLELWKEGTGQINEAIDIAVAKCNSIPLVHEPTGPDTGV